MLLAFIEVNEKGTEAVMVTSVEVKAESATQPSTMDVNRPFFFTIEDGSTGTMAKINRGGAAATCSWPLKQRAVIKL
ncbi:serpin family protein [Paenibacillus harenae]|uniref:Serine protease inhibitor n=1 Tax=Paenibacillus harenae TaxID=306543 RepID=A0ABT9U0J2_PAEHA|nr:serpin family protein [Paenibacillus harenae]MDQ0111959.1 serine protease inhibitor [Paenibacillus harenae]